MAIVIYLPSIALAAACGLDVNLDSEITCTQFACMIRKTISIDKDVYQRLKKLQLRHESFSATLRRVLEEEKDPADYIDELFRDFGGKGMMTGTGLARLRARQKNPPHSNRPAHWRRRAHAA